MLSIIREMLSETLGDSINVSFLHGKMKEKEKDEVMNAFGRNEIQVLVSTTVVEVGIDVPNATVMHDRKCRAFRAGAASSVERKGWSWKVSVLLHFHDSIEIKRNEGTVRYPESFK